MVKVGVNEVLSHSISRINHVIDKSIILSLILAKELFRECFYVKGILDILYFKELSLLIKSHKVISCCTTRLTWTKQECISFTVSGLFFVAALSAICETPIPTSIILVMEQHKGTRKLIHDSTYKPLNVYAITLHHYTVTDSYVENLQWFNANIHLSNLLNATYTSSIGKLLALWLTI